MSGGVFVLHDDGRLDEMKVQRRRTEMEVARSSSQAPISGNAKNQPGMVQCGKPRAPQSGVIVKRMIGGKARQSRNRRRSSDRRRQADARPVVSGMKIQGDR